MANLALVFDLIAKDGASGPFKNVGNAAERAGNQTSRFGTAMSGAMKLASGALLGAGLVEGFKALYNAADESRKIAALTAQVIKSTGGAAQVSAKQVGDLAASIAKKTGVDDEAIQSGSNLLLTFTKVKNEVGAGNDIFNQATSIMTDMSVALGTDASGSAIQLGKALNDPIKGVSALTRVGVSFTEQQKDQIRTLVESGDTLGAQKIILAELGREFGGAAEAAATPLGKLQQRIGDVAEEVGGKLVPFVDRAATFLMDDFGPAAGDVANTVGNVLGPALHTAGETLGFIYETGKGAVDLFNDLPGPVQVTVGALGAMAVLKGPLGSLFSTLKDVGETAYLRTLLLKDALGGVGGAAGVAKGALGGLVGLFGGPWGIAVAAVAGSFALLNAATDTNEKVTSHATEAQQGLADALRESKGAIDENVRSAAAKSLQDAGLLDIADKAGISLSRMTDAILGNKGAYNEVSSALEAYANNRLIASGYEEHGKTTMHDQADAAGQAVTDFGTLAGTLGETAQGQQQLAEATNTSAESMGPAANAAEELKTQLEDTASAAGEARQQTDLFKTSLDVLTGQNVSLLQVQSQLYDALSAAKDAMNDEGGAVLDSAGALNLHTENGRKAADVLLDVRNSGNELIATMIQQGATTDQVAAKDAELRASFVESAKQMGISNAAALALADQILGIPASRTTTITADTTQPTAAVNSLQALINGLKGRTVDIIANAIGPDLNGAASGSGRFGLAFGGLVPGSSPHDRADNIPIMGTAGEFMQPIPAVRKYGLGFMEAVQTGRFPAELAQGFADGGLVGAPLSIKAELDTRNYSKQMDTYARQVLDHLEPVTGLIGALSWARSQEGKPYVWGGVGPSGYDCSGWISAITNVIRGRNPHSRVGSTASFPWPGFADGSGLFTVGSTKNAGGGIGHMTGQLLGVNVESTGNHVRVGGDARSPFAGMFDTRASLKFHGGGIVPNLGMPNVPALLAPGETVRTVQQEAALQQPVFNVRVYVGDREITDIARVEAEAVVVGALNGARNQSRFNS